MPSPDLATLASTLGRALVERAPCAPVTEAAPNLTVEDAYTIQRWNVEERLRRGLHGRPARLVGHKIGITSKAVQDWLKVREPDFGCLLDDMVVEDGGEAPMRFLLQPRVEGEIAFVLGSALQGPGVTAADVLRATDFVLPCVEVVDSRVRDWKIQYVDTIADNASSGLFLLGTRPVSLRGIDLPLVGMALRKNGQVVSTGAGAACLGNPVSAVAWLANKLAELSPDGPGLQAGHVVLSGALGPVAPIEAGDVIEVELAHLGRASMRFV